LWGCSKATVERDLAKGFEIRPLRSSVTAECFAVLLLEGVRARDAKPAPTAGYVAGRGRHGVKVGRGRKARKLAKGTAPKRTARRGA
jgi:hypothetical protein